MSEPLIRQTVFGVMCHRCNEPIVIYRLADSDLVTHGEIDPDVILFPDGYGEQSYKTAEVWITRLHGEPVA
jgi:hypothetical protein